MRLDREPAITSVPLTALLRADTGRPGTRVRALYPDLALPSEDGGRLALLTHGRCIDPVCTSMSEFARMLAPHAKLPADAETLERENWPWIELFFSSMTRSGRPGARVELIYGALQDEQAFERIVDAVARNVTIDQGRLKGGAERWTIKHVAGGLARKLAAARERGGQSGVLSPGGRRALGRLRRRPAAARRDRPGRPAGSGLPDPRPHAQAVRRVVARRDLAGRRHRRAQHRRLGGRPPRAAPARRRRRGAGQ
jgi:hypothetical protein